MIFTMKIAEMFVNWCAEASDGYNYCSTYKCNQCAVIQLLGPINTVYEVETVEGCKRFRCMMWIQWT